MRVPVAPQALLAFALARVLDVGHSDKCIVISRFSLHFPVTWLACLFVCLSSVCHLCWGVCLGLWSILKFFLKLKYRHSLCILENSPFSQFSCSAVSTSAIPWTAALQASLSITNSQSLLKQSFLPDTFCADIVSQSSLHFLDLFLCWKVFFFFLCWKVLVFYFNEVLLISYFFHELCLWCCILKNPSHSHGF